MTDFSSSFVAALIGFAVGRGLFDLVVWGVSKRRVKSTPGKEIAASRIEEAAKSMNMSVEEMIAFYEQHDGAYAAKLRELAKEGR